MRFRNKPKSKLEYVFFKFEKKIRVIKKVNIQLKLKFLDCF